MQPINNSNTIVLWKRSGERTRIRVTSFCTNEQVMLTNICVFLSVFYFCSAVRISTYNLWNVMFHWKIRKYRIAEMIREERPDIICFQEVRSGAQAELENQILELKTLLPSSYKWHIFRVANNVSLVKNSINNEWIGEGLGLISSLPVVSESVQFLTIHKHDPDTNQRIVLHVALQINPKTVLNLVLIHLSYQRQQQCKNMAEILRFITDRRLRNVVIAGDFNTYSDFDWPIKLALGVVEKGTNPCLPHTRKYDLSNAGNFKDAWLEGKSTGNGFTFSNMPTPGFESRPDRILVSSHFQIESVSLIGNGSRYKDVYKSSIHWLRFTSVFQSSFLSYQAVDGYPCLHDCGPHGSCNCGVCKSGGNKDSCSLKDCDICSKELFQRLILNFILFSVIFIHLFYSLVVILVVGAGSYSESLFSILGCNCCLCNPRLCLTTIKLHSRRYRLMRVCQVWPVFRLPPYLQLFLSFGSLILFMTYVRSWLHPVLDLTYATMDEEFFPSDHLMFTAEIT